MDKESQKVFDQIVSMDQESLSDEQKGFLMARRSYMNDEQRKRYAGMIKLHEDGKLFVKEVALEDMDLKQLKAEAKKRKVSITGLKTEEEIIEALQEAEDAE
jgi:hypothetical protein